MKIIWTDFAIENLKIIFEYYAKNANKKVAHKIRKQILHSIKTAHSKSKIRTN
jgi:toxin ParE1/3/4